MTPTRSAAVPQTKASGYRYYKMQDEKRFSYPRQSTSISLKYHHGRILERATGHHQSAASRTRHGIRLGVNQDDNRPLRIHLQDFQPQLCPGCPFCQAIQSYRVRRIREVPVHSTLSAQVAEARLRAILRRCKVLHTGSCEPNHPHRLSETHGQKER